MKTAIQRCSGGHIATLRWPTGCLVELVLSSRSSCGGFRLLEV
jgi:hypothetical protein